MNNYSAIGNLTATPELKYSQAGKAVVKFTLAIRRDKETTDFPRMVAFGKTAELIAEYCRKGDKIGIEGSVWTGSYENEGRKVYTTDICVNKLHFLNSKKDKNEKVEDSSDDIEDSFPF